MELGGAKQFVLGDRNRTTMFPSLKKSFYKPKSINGRELNDYSLDEKAYRMTSNQLLKGILRQNDSEIKKLRTTFMRPNGIEERGKKKIGQYEIIKEIGKGGFAQVYEVEDANHNKYALKEYNLQNAGECFQNESAMGQFFFERGAVREQFSHHPGTSTAKQAAPTSSASSTSSASANTATSSRNCASTISPNWLATSRASSTTTNASTRYIQAKSGEVQGILSRTDQQKPSQEGYDRTLPNYTAH